ncbi:hypothetical protein SAMN05421858_3047 [Haladaptatus litoreus]|uniref:Uncharacterized protein n=1 Tax=Haladaptatus litoreus TaxID=553468 RepID=A0A1N7CJK7_9EURY|nr:hypothetical protein SAMN05421858_3047 [Haladaptatus litoreus]
MLYLVLLSKRCTRLIHERNLLVVKTLELLTRCIERLSSYWQEIDRFRLANRRKRLNSCCVPNLVQHQCRKLREYIPTRKYWPILTGFHSIEHSIRRVVIHIVFTKINTVLQTV